MTKNAWYCSLMVSHRTLCVLPWFPPASDNKTRLVTVSLYERWFQKHKWGEWKSESEKGEEPGNGMLISELLLWEIRTPFCQKLSETLCGSNSRKVGEAGAFSAKLCIHYSLKATPDSIHSLTFWGLPAAQSLNKQTNKQTSSRKKRKRSL